MHKANILIVDDEKAIVQMIEIVLRKEGFEHIYTAGSAEEGMALLREHRADVILLDVMLPDRTGFELGPQIRAQSDAHLIYLTARATDLDRLTGFAVGGDDYVTKPFNPLEIAARIKARLRRGTVEAAPLPAASAAADLRKRHDFGGFVLDEPAGELLVGGNPVPCPAQAYQLLLFLCRNPNIVFSKSQLYESVWGFDGLSDDNTVMVHIRKIRERIEPDPGSPRYLLTIRGLGYKLVKGSDE
ncbi:response regulator [Saccharibacillus alkalitolerans]|uniref:Response regulator transcription factor n=1 Tax=Saccharibacillus alkalitolerans TaxID=2705290 RepID=A0ABX0F7V0_9BACL|nr:response regulator transcription factor [Saccharibacillus alkalitolerans]NGZ75584.1 response regulator transcription factor [Saccharibacillus alkalitolerans]